MIADSRPFSQPHQTPAEGAKTGPSDQSDYRAPAEPQDTTANANARTPDPLSMLAKKLPHGKRLANLRLKIRNAKENAWDLEKYLLDFNIGGETEALVRGACDKPSRYPSGFISHTVYLPCVHFGTTLKLESRTICYAHVLQAMYRADVRMIVEEIPKRKIFDENGKFLCSYTGDLLLLFDDGKIEVWETRSTGTLARQVSKSPAVYCERDGRYYAPPIEAYFKKLGIRFRILTERDILPRLAQAVEALHPYVQAFPPVPFSDEEVKTFAVAISKSPGLRLRDVPIEDTGRRTELAMHLLATGKLFTSLSEFDRENPGDCRLYPTPQDEKAYTDFLSAERPIATNLEQIGYRLRPGSMIQIAGVSHKAVSLTSRSVRLEAPDGTQQDYTFQTLIDQKARIGRIYNSEKTFDQLFSEAPMERRMSYVYRKAQIKEFLPGGTREGKSPEDRSVRRWLAAYSTAIANGLSGDEAIFPKNGNSGRKRQWDAAVTRRVEELLKEHYKKRKDCSLEWVVNLLISEFDISRLPSRSTLYRWLRDIDRYGLAVIRRGVRNAKKIEPYYGDSPTMGSPLGYRYFQHAHIDAQNFDLAMEAGEKLHYIRMVDSYTGVLLAHVLTDRLDQLAIRELILDCVARHGALPSYIVCDWGSVHRAEWLQSTLGAINVTLDYRPKSDGRKGQPVEGSFSSLVRSLVHNLEGNTHLLKDARMITKAHSPEQDAIWTTAASRALLEELFRLSNSLGTDKEPSPDSLAEACIRKWGLPPRQVPNADEFRKILLPLAEGSTRVVTERGAIRCFNKTFSVVGINNPLLEYAGKSVVVRGDMKVNPNEIYVFPNDQRVSFRCICVNVTGPSEDIKIVAAELDKAKFTSTPDCPVVSPEKQFANFVADTVKTEKALKQAKKRKRRQAKAAAVGRCDDQDADIPQFNNF